MARVLVHVCCGPCSLMPIQHLQEEGHDVTAFFFNPNIHPQEEYALRVGAMRQAADFLNVPLLVAGEAVHPDAWVAALGAETVEGVRCRACYRVRLNATAEMANAHGFDYFTSSLLYSRYQHHDAIIAEAEGAARASAVYNIGVTNFGRLDSEVQAFGICDTGVHSPVAHKYGVRDSGDNGSAAPAPAAFLYHDFRLYWRQGIDKSKEMGLYRQKWCGCILSKGEAEAQREQKRKEKETRTK